MPSITDRWYAQFTKERFSHIGGLGLLWVSPQLSYYILSDASPPAHKISLGKIRK